MANPPLSDSAAQEAVDTLSLVGTIQGAARSINVPVGTFRNRLLVASRRGILPFNERLEVIHGALPDHPEISPTLSNKPLPSPLILKGTSTLYDDAGNPKLQWVKATVDQQAQEQAMYAAIDALMNKVPRAKPTELPNNTFDHLCNVYTLSDVHVGMRAWEPEAGSNWDLSIAENTITNAVYHLIKNSPKAKTCVINQLGDFLHSDSIQPITPTSGHLLDMDSRFSKVVSVSTRILRSIIDFALQRHEKVIVLMAEGNHDISSSIWLRHLFSLLYENEPRIEMIQSENPYYTYRHGQTMLAFHHGHLAKPDQLPLLFAAAYHEIWGSTRKRYCHIGHKHHFHAKEHSGMLVVQHPTIASRDAYAARGGWFADRRIIGFTYHSKHGEVGSISVTPEMLD